MGSHAIKSPSGADRWMLCPGSIQMESGVEDTPSEAKDEGTAAHLLGSTALDENKAAAQYIGQTINIVSDVNGEDHALWNSRDYKNYTHRRSYVVDADMAMHVQQYINVVRFYQERGYTLYVETAVPIYHLTGEKGARGTADAILTKGNRIVVIDLKFGHNPVEVMGNRQLRFYALGAVEHHSLVQSFDEVVMVISQPRVFDAPKSWIIKVKEELMPFADEIERASAAADKPDAPRIPGEKQCYYCKAKHVCPEIAEVVKNGIGVNDFDDLTKIDEQTVNKKINGLDENDINSKMNVVGVVGLWCKAISKKAAEIVLTGGKLLHWKVVQGNQGNREWKNEKAVVAKLKEWGLTDKQIYEKKIISPAKVDTLYKQGVLQLPNIGELDRLIVRKDGEPTMAHISDKREPLVLKSIVDEFDDLTANDGSDLV